MLTSILSFLGLIAGPLAQLSNKIADLKMARVTAESDIERKKIDSQIEKLHDQRMIMVAEAQAGNRSNAYMRAFIAFGPASYVFKFFAWDKVVGGYVGCANNNTTFCRAWFTTDAILSDPMIYAMTAVIGFYLLTSRNSN